MSLTKTEKVAVIVTANRIALKWLADADDAIPSDAEILKEVLELTKDELDEELYTAQKFVASMGLVEEKISPRFIKAKHIKEG